MKEYRIPKEYQQLQHAASIDETRYNITGVRFQDGYAVATNGHIFAARKVSPGESESLPMGKTVRFTAPRTETEHADDIYCPDCDCFIPADDDYMPRPAESFAEVSDKLLASDTHVAHVTDGKFPGLGEVVRQTKHAQPIRIAIDPRILIQLSKAWDCDGVVLEIEAGEGGEKRPILVCPQRHGKYDRDCIGAILPRIMDEQAGLAPIRDEILASVETEDTGQSSDESLST